MKHRPYPVIPAFLLKVFTGAANFFCKADVQPAEDLSPYISLLQEYKKKREPLGRRVSEITAALEKLLDSGKPDLVKQAVEFIAKPNVAVQLSPEKLVEFLDQLHPDYQKEILVHPKFYTDEKYQGSDYTVIRDHLNKGGHRDFVLLLERQWREVSPFDPGSAKRDSNLLRDLKLTPNVYTLRPQTVLRAVKNLFASANPEWIALACEALKNQEGVTAIVKAGYKDELREVIDSLNPVTRDGILDADTREILGMAGPAALISVEDGRYRDIVVIPAIS